MARYEAASGGFREVLRGIADPRSLGWAGFLLSTFLVVGLQLIGLIALDPDRPHYLLPRVGLLVLSQTLMYLLLLATVRPLLAKPWMSGRWLITLCLFGLGGLFRQAMFSLLIRPFEVQPLQNPLGRYLTAMLTTILAVGFAALLSSLTREEGRLRRTLADERRRLAWLRSEVAAELESCHRETLEQIRFSMSRAFQSLPAAASAESALALRTAVDEVVRPMSRRLAASLPSVQSFQPPPSSGDVGWTVTLRRAARHFRIYPGGVALAILLLGLSTLIGTFGPLTGALLAAVNALVIWIALWVLRRVGQGTSRFALLLSRPVPGLAISSAAVFVAELVLLPVAGRTDHPRILLVGTMLLVPACLWTIYFARNLLVQQQEMNSTLMHTTWEVRTEIARLQTMAWSRQRTLARALHGPVQAVITATALRLDMAKARQAKAYLDVDGLREEILEVIENSGHPGDEGSLASGVSRIQLVWSRVCDIRLLVEPDCVAVLEGGETVHAALEVIQEACSNAVRHGAATQVSVAVRLSKDATDSLQIDIRDNGRSTTDTSQPRGLGSEILDDVALTWHRETSHGGTLLSVLLPMVNMSDTSGGPR